MKTDMKKTKIVCTIGPKTESKEMLAKMLDAGMNVMRLNFSHGDYAEHGGRISNLRAVMAETGKHAAILLDTKGPEIRTIKLEGGNDVALVAGQTFTFTTDQTVVGNKDKVAVTYAGFANDLRVGNRILVDDGLIGLDVIEITEREVVCKVLNNGDLGENKGINLPGVSIKLPALAEKDKRDLIFGCEQGVDFVAASFIRKKEDVLEIREHLKAHGGENIQIISKIENQEGLDNFDEILAVSDGIMVARGDMGVEIPVEEVIFAQKMIIEKCNKARKVVITATQMLDSMIRNPRPTRAEVSDVANAVFDGTSCVMLSGETASGKYPIEALSTMVSTVTAAEEAIDYWGRFRERSLLPVVSGISDAITHSCCLTAMDLNASAILAATRSGYTAKVISRFRPACPIVALCQNESTRRQLAISWGVHPYLSGEVDSTDRMFSLAVDVARKENAVQIGDTVVITAGVPLGQSGTTNLIKAQIVEGGL